MKGVKTLDDRYIVELFFQRQKRALTLTAEKYGGYCYTVSHNILGRAEDAEECVNDTYLAAWNCIPPNKPSRLGAFLAKLTRRISIDRWRKNTAQKRGAWELNAVFEELEECIPDGGTPERELLEQEFARSINAFLMNLPEAERRVFLLRYFYAEAITSICETMHFTKSRVSSMLMRTRQKLKAHLIKEEYYEFR